MREKVGRILDLIRTGKLTLEDAAPLLAALHPRLAVQGADRELLDALLSREDLSAAQIAEHLLLLRGVKDTPAAPARAAPDDPTWIGDLPGATFTRHFERRKGGLEQMLENITGTVERAVDTALEGVERGLGGQNSRGRASRILTVRVESSQGDEYTGNFPLSLAPHLHKLIPPYGLRALDQAGFSLDTLQLLIAADPPSGDLIHAEDHEGNEVYISIK